MKSITILLITYNHEHLIARALDSILCQKEWGLKRIIIGDDCSTDNTYNILKSYQHKYPNIIEIYRNNPNQGIYQNMENVVLHRGESDLYSTLSGDDTYDKDYFKHIQMFCKENIIDYSKPIGIYSNLKVINKDKIEIIDKSSSFKKGVSLVSLYLRGKLSNSLFVNEEVLKKFRPLKFEYGLFLAEGMFDIQLHMYTQKAYYINTCGYEYHAGIGISTTLNINKPYYKEECIACYQYFIDNFLTTKRDIRFAKANIYRSRFYIEKKYIYFIIACWYYFFSSYPSCITSYKTFKSFIWPMLIIIKQHKK